MLSALSAPFLVWLLLRVALFETGAVTHSYLTFFKKSKKRKKKAKTQFLFFSIFPSMSSFSNFDNISALDWS